MLTALCLLAAAQTSVDPAITFVSPADRLESICVKLTEASGTTITCNNAVADSSVVVAVKGRALSDTLERLAVAVGARVRATDSGYVIERTSAIEAAEARAHSAEYGAQIQKELDKVLKKTPTSESVAKMIDDAAELDKRLANSNEINAETWQEVQEVTSGMPQRHVLYQILNSLGATYIASLPPGERVVFSTDPTSLQLPLKDGPRWAAAFDKSIKLHAEVLATKSMTESESGYFYELTNSYTTPNHTTTRLTVVLQPNEYGLSANVLAYGQDGIPASANMSINTVDFNGMMEEKPLPEIANTLEGEVEVSDEFKTFVAIMDPTQKTITLEQRRALAARLADLSQPDLTGSVMGNALLTLHREKGVDVIGRMSLYGMIFAAPGGTFPEVIKAAPIVGGMLSMPELGWTLEDNLMSSRSSASDTYYNLPVKLLAQGAEIFLKNGRLRLEESLMLCATAKDEFQAQMFWQIMQALEGSTSGVNYSDVYGVSKLYASLDNVSRTRAKNGGVELIGNAIRGATFEQMKKMLLNGNMGYSFASFGGPDGLDPHNYYMQEPTYALAQPQAQPLNIKVSLIEENAVYAGTVNGAQSWYNRSGIGQIAEGVALGELAQRSGVDYYPILERFAYVRQETLTIDIKAGSVSNRQEAIAKPIEPLAINKTIDQLPANIRDELQKAIAEARERYKDTTFGAPGGGGGGRIDPP